MTYIIHAVHGRITYTTHVCADMSTTVVVLSASQRVMCGVMREDLMMDARHSCADDHTRMAYITHASCAE